MDRGVMLGVVDRKMTHETKEDDGDQWTRVVSCVFPVHVSRGDFFRNCSYQRKSEVNVLMIFLYLNSLPR
jgi:hypothetical protein